MLDKSNLSLHGHRWAKLLGVKETGNVKKISVLLP